MVIPLVCQQTAFAMPRGNGNSSGRGARGSASGGRRGSASGGRGPDRSGGDPPSDSPHFQSPQGTLNSNPPPSRSPPRFRPGSYGSESRYSTRRPGRPRRISTPRGVSSSRAVAGLFQRRPSELVRQHQLPVLHPRHLRLSHPLPLRFREARTGSLGHRS